jgi:hypothetical protein
VYRYWSTATSEYRAPTPSESVHNKANQSRKQGHERRTVAASAMPDTRQITGRMNIRPPQGLKARASSWRSSISGVSLPDRTERRQTENAGSRTSDGLSTPWRSGASPNRPYVADFASKTGEQYGAHCRSNTCRSRTGCALRRGGIMRCPFGRRSSHTSPDIAHRSARSSLRLSLGRQVDPNRSEVPIRGRTMDLVVWSVLERVERVR